MKVLKQGQPPKPASFWIGEILNCKNCGSEFQLEESDAVSVSAERTPGGKVTIMAYCPCCSTIQSKVFNPQPQSFVCMKHDVREGG